MKRVVLIGDSIRMGYQETVRTELGNSADVWGPKQNGGTSEKVLSRLDHWAITREPDVLHINCGLHDLKREFGQAAAAIPPDVYEQNVRTIMTRARRETDAIVVWALTTPVNQEWHHKNKSFDRFEADVSTYNALAANIARDLDIVVNDLFAVVTAEGRDGLLLADGVHFTPEGYALLGRRVADCIREVTRTAGTRSL